MAYQDENASLIDGWVRVDNQWGDVTGHEAFLRAKAGGVVGDADPRKVRTSRVVSGFKWKRCARPRGGRRTADADLRRMRRALHGS